MSFTPRRLPHACPQGKWLFLTWHLHGSLPHGVYPPPDMASGGKACVWMDRYLDHASTGPLFLRQPSIASIVIDSLHKGVELGALRFRSVCCHGQSCASFHCVPRSIRVVCCNL